MRPAPVALLLCLLPSTASISCGPSWTHVHDNDAPDGVVALGERVRITFIDRRVGPVECHQSEGCNDGKPYQQCSTPTIEARKSVESVACDNCSAAVASVADGVISVDLDGYAEGPAHLVLNVHDEGGAASKEEATIRFERARALRLMRPFYSSPQGVAYASLPETSHVWCPRLDGVTPGLLHRPDHVAVILTGPATLAESPGAWREGIVTAGGCVTFQVSAPGAVSLEFAYGEIVRAEKVRVIEPADVVGIDLVDVGKLGATDDLVDVEVDPMRALPALGRLEADGCPTGQRTARVGYRVRTRSGDTALGNLRSLRISPPALAYLTPPIDNSGTVSGNYFADIVAKSAGGGLVVAEVGGTHFGVPLRLAGDCLLPLPSDGAVTDADAGDSGSTDDH